MLTKEEIRKIAHLARLGLSEKEIDRFTEELQGILGYFAKLDELDTSGIEPVAQITGLENITRPDEVVPSALAKEILAVSPNEVQGNHIKVKNVF